MLRACVISSKGSWEKWLPLAEFSNNNSYQGSIKMAPFEALYGRKCKTLLNWIEPDVYTKIWKEERGNSKLLRLYHQEIDQM